MLWGRSLLVACRLMIAWHIILWDRCKTIKNTWLSHLASTFCVTLNFFHLTFATASLYGLPFIYRLHRALFILPLLAVTSWCLLIRFMVQTGLTCCGDRRTRSFCSGRSGILEAFYSFWTQSVSQRKAKSGIDFSWRMEWRVNDKILYRGYSATWLIYSVLGHFERKTA